EIALGNRVAFRRRDRRRVGRARLAVEDRHLAEDGSRLELAQRKLLALRRDQRELDASRDENDQIGALVAALEDHGAGRPFAPDRDCGDLADRLLVETLENGKGTPEGGTPVDLVHVRCPRAAAEDEET